MSIDRLHAAALPPAAAPRPEDQPGSPAAGPARAAAPAAAPRAEPDGAASLRAAAIAAGTAARKSDGPEGTERVLLPHQVRRIERLYAAAPTEVARALDASLARIGGKDAALGRALFLKAAAARAEALGADPACRAAALAALDAFAARLDGMAAADMLARATVEDLDSRVSTSDFDPRGLDVSHGRPGKGGAGDRRKDNDGLFQRFTASCGTTALEILLCEEDPIRAFAAHDAGLTSWRPDDAVGRFQAEMLEKYGGVAISRHALHRFAALKREIKKALDAGTVTEQEVEAFRAHVLGGKPLDEPGRRAREAIRKQAGGFPSDAEIEEIRAGRFPRRDEGLGFEEMGKALADVLAPVTGARYEQTPPPEGFGAGKAAKHLDAVERALRRGLDVPFGISEPPHWMLLSAVSGRAPERRFLVTDPDGGITDWVGEKDFVKGTFLKTPFDLQEGQKKGHVDSFFLPAEA